jgi:hypothetical protein
MVINEEKRRSIIAERKTAARPLFDMARTVAVEFGGKRGKKYGTWHEFTDAENGLFIAYDDYGNNLHILFNKGRVLNVHTGNIIGYVPNQRWESMLRQHYARAGGILQKRDHTAVAKEVNELVAKWGITPEDVDYRRAPKHAD